MAPPPDPSLARRIDAIFAAFARAGSPGCAVGVQRDGELLFSAGYGLASVEHQVPIAPRTRFRVASVSKQFTVTAVHLLAAQGRLRLDDDVREHVPELSALPQRVTLDQLMRNTSGLPDFLELLRLGGLGLDMPLDRRAMLHTIAGCQHLNFTPGSCFLYCNSNFLLLGLVVERRTGCGLGEILRREVFAPLHMDNTTLEVAADGVVPHLAAPYLRDADGGLRRALHGFEHGGEGGLVSNVPDLLAWTAELQRPTCLPADLLAWLSSPTRLNDGAASPYARGLEHSRVHGLDCVGHGGLWPGYRTELLQLPQAALSVVVISNDGASNPYLLARQVLEAVLAPTPTVAVPADASALMNCCGSWLSSATPALFDLALVHGEPVVTQWGTPFALQVQPDGRWLPLRGAYEFALRMRDARSLEVDLGAGQTLSFERLVKRVSPDAGLAGCYACTDIGATWDIRAPTGEATGWQVQVRGPHRGAPVPWPLRGLTADLVELETPSPWLRSTQLARLERDTEGRILALQVFSGRVRGLRFVRLGSAATAVARARRG
jgi:D-aminopeptidase